MRAQHASNNHESDARATLRARPEHHARDPAALKRALHLTLALALDTVRPDSSQIRTCSEKPTSAQRASYNLESDARATMHARAERFFRLETFGHLRQSCIA
jgi:hypothetical protein